eukprot:m.136856 g.136856  ORF g.136856 m.136856 type:complete len:72 (+) comp52481_c0_seq3:59-274(+)
MNPHSQFFRHIFDDRIYGGTSVAGIELGRLDLPVVSLEYNTLASCITFCWRSATAFIVSVFPMASSDFCVM